MASNMFRRTALAVAVVMMLNTACFQTLYAQQTELPGDNPESLTTTLDQVNVTGSRIMRRDYEAESPIATVSREQIEVSTGVTLEQKLNQMPQFVGSNGAVGNNTRTTGVATLNLRGVGDYRNLVLLDGQRLVPSTGTGVVDINTIPSIALGDIEVITGGASAVYGSDAIAGVINFHINHHFEGMKARVQYGTTEQGDGEETQVGVLFGGKFADGRGRAMLGFEYTDRKKVLDRDRDFYHDAYRRAAGGQASMYRPQGYYQVTGSPNQPSAAAVNALFASYGVAGNVPVGDFSFNDDLTLFAVDGGAPNYRGELYPRYGISANGTFYWNSAYDYDILSSPMERYASIGSLSFEITDNTEAYFRFHNTRYTTIGNNSPAPVGGLWVINVPYDNDHPVPQDLATLLDSRPDPTADYQMGKAFLEAGERIVEHNNENSQYTFGLRGHLPWAEYWTWDSSFSSGRTRLTSEYLQGAFNYHRMQELINLPNYGAGASDAPNGYFCTSGVQLFGLTPMSADCMNWLTERVRSLREIKQEVFEASIQGPLLKFPAGDLLAAAGVAYRRNSYAFSPDPMLSAAVSNNVAGIFGAAPTAGSTHVKEVFIETLVPVLSGRKLVEELNLTLAYRRSDYNFSGAVNTWKTDFNWRMNDTLRLRGGYQRAIRAPNTNELFEGGELVVGGWPGTDPCSKTTSYPYGNMAGNPNLAQTRQLCIDMGVPLDNGAAGNPADDSYSYSTPAVLGIPAGNTSLTPETAKTWTIGGVWSLRPDSERLRNLSLSLDYYNIKVIDAIGLLAPAEVYAKCFNADGISNPAYSASNQYCQLVGRDDGSTTTTGIGTGVPTWVDQLYMNLGGIHTSGVDLQLELGLDFGRVGGLNMSVVANYLNKFELQTIEGEPWVDYAGTAGSTTTSTSSSALLLPDWKTLTTLSWVKDDWMTGVRWTHYPAVDYYMTRSNPQDTTRGADAYDRFDLFAQWKVSSQLTLRASVDNLADKQPNQVTAVASNTIPAAYDVYGRRYSVSIEYDF